ncbi:MAG TPA: hypothetical protein VGI70_20525, partial [Polyangiales bacterium]
WIRALVYTASVLAALTLLIAALHTSAARPLLARLGMKCPLDASPAEVEAARLESARVTRGTEAAASRPALGFVLDQTTLADVKAWAEKKNVSCDEARTRSLLHCTNVPETALGKSGPEFNDLDFGFSPSNARLVNISAWRSGMSSRAASAQMKAIAASLAAELGAPASTKGDLSARYFASGPMRTAFVQYRFSDYIADVTATNIPDKGLILREHYMSARD